MMQAQFADSGSYGRSKFMDCRLIGAVRQNNQLVRLNASDNITGTAQAAADGLHHSSQAGIGGMAAEYLEISSKVVH